MTSLASSTKRIYRFAAIIPAMLIALAMFATPAAHAWGCQGHEVVAMIAEMHLNPHALAMVNKLLTDYPRDPALNKYLQRDGTHSDGRRRAVGRRLSQRPSRN